MLIVDGFGGMGGWSEGLKALGHADVGIELDRWACATRRAAGHPTIRADMTAYPPDAFEGATGAIFSPPCPDWSVAGKQAGRDGTSGHLIDVVPRWVDVIRPEWVVCEQVPPCLDIWREHARFYATLGYSTWAGILNAANFGVPQTRQRAFLIASRTRLALPPEPTHSRFGDDSIFGTLQPWQTMAEALGWGLTERPGFTYCGGNEGGPDLAGGSGARAALKAEREAARWELDRRQNGAPVLDPHEVPSPTMTGAAIGKGVWTVRAPWQLRSGIPEVRNSAARTPLTEPAPTVAFGHDAASWCWERPSTAVCGTDRVSQPGWRGRPEDYSADGTYNGKRSMDEAIRLTVADALILQGFRPDYPVQGKRTAAFLQVGNAVCPPLATAVLSSVL